MKTICDDDFGGKSCKGRFSKQKEYKFVILDNSGGVALFGSDGEYKLPVLEKYEDEFTIDNIEAEINSKLMNICLEKSEDKIKKELEVYVAKVSKKDDVNVKWVRPEEALMLISKYKKNIDEFEYDRKFEILSDESILREYIIKYIY